MRRYRLAFSLDKHAQVEKVSPAHHPFFTAGVGHFTHFKLYEWMVRVTIGMEPRHYCSGFCYFSLSNQPVGLISDFLDVVEKVLLLTIVEIQDKTKFLAQRCLDIKFGAIMGVSNPGFHDRRGFDVLHIRQPSRLWIPW